MANNYRLTRRQLAEGELYHIYNRGVEKRNIFLSRQDYTRFLFSVLAFRFSDSVTHIERQYQKYQTGQHSMLTNNDDALVNIVCYCLMPNHFHFIVEEVAENGISRFMQRLGNSYTKYFNIKYNRHGHLFGSAYHSIHIDNNEYLVYVSRYIHRNPQELPLYKNKIIEYPWSSYQYYMKNAINPHIQSQIICEQFANVREYKEYVEEAIDDVIDDEYLLDSKYHKRSTFNVDHKTK